MGELTLNGLNEKIEGLEKVMNVYLENIQAEIKDIKDNELKHMRDDIENLKKFQYKVMGGIAAIVTIIEIIFKVIR